MDSSTQIPLKPRAGPRPAGTNGSRRQRLSGRPLTVVALFGLGLLFAAWILLHRFENLMVWAHCIAALAACAPWLITPRTRWRRVDRLDRLGSLALALGVTLGFTRDLLPGDAATLIVVELGVEAVGAIAFAMVFYRRASLARLRLGIDGGELLRTACESVGEPIVVVGPGCRVLEVNWFAEILYSTRLIGKLACETPYFTRDRCEGCPVARCFDERRPVFFAHRGQDGRAQHEIAAFPVVHDGEFIGRQIQRVTDVAIRTQSERHLRFLAHVVDAVSDAVLGLDLRGVVTTANAEAERLLATEGNALVGQDALDVLRLGPGVDRERVAHLLDRREAGRFELALTVPGRHGTRDMVVSLYPVVDDDGNAAGAALLLHDETEARVAHERLRQAERLSLLGRFVSSVAHELNNPLAVVYGRAEQFVNVARAESASTDPTVRAAQDVLDAAERCRRIVAGLLRYARKDGSSRAVVDLRDVAREALDLVAQLELARRCGARVELHADSDPVVVQGDAVLLAQVATNLITNACHSIRRGGGAGTVKVTVARHGDQCTLEVADDGPGLDPAAAAHLFEAFHTTKREGEGTGIGLWLSFALVEDHGGSFEFQERRPHGALFRVRLPATTMPLPTCAIDPVHEVRRSGSTPKTWAVLVVDDEEGIRDLLEAQLTHAGHEVTVAAGGREGLAHAVSGRHFDAVVCDRMMPDLSGGELYKRAIAAVPMLRGRFVFVTGDVLSEDANDVSRCDGNEVLTKPFRAADLLAAVERVARRALDVSAI